MKTIIVAEQAPFPVSNILVRFCEEYGGALISSPGKCFSTCADPIYNIILTDGSAKISLPGSTVIFAEDNYDNFNIDLSGCTAVINRYDFNALRIAEHYGCTAMICSISGNDTLTISSSDDDSCLISLNRSIKTPRGITEPCEYIFRRFNDAPDEIILSCGAALLCCGTRL